MTDLRVFGRMAGACASASVEETMAWELYHDIRKRDPNVANASGPALPPAMLEARVNAGTDLQPVDIGVYSHPLYLATEYGVRSEPVEGEAPAALLVAAKEATDHMVVRPVTVACHMHRECLTHGTVINHKGDAHAWAQCERGVRDAACLPPLMQDVTVPIEPGISDLILAAEGHDKQILLRHGLGLADEGVHWMRPVFAGGPLYYDPAAHCLRGGGYSNAISRRIRLILHDRRRGFEVGDNTDLDWGGARWIRPPELEIPGYAQMGMW